jgi:hypothetical protein
MNLIYEFHYGVRNKTMQSFRPTFFFECGFCVLCVCSSVWGCVCMCVCLEWERERFCSLMISKEDQFFIEVITFYLSALFPILSSHEICFEARVRTSQILTFILKSRVSVSMTNIVRFTLVSKFNLLP